MMTLGHSGMDEADVAPRSPLWRWVRIIAVFTVMLSVAGYGTGFLVGHSLRGGSLSLRASGILAASVLVTLACGWQLRRDLRRPPGEAPLTAKERLNRNVLIGSALAGAVMAIALLAFSDRPLADADLFSNHPLPTGLAVFLVIAIGIFMPILYTYWLRHAVDEQEVDAYKTGSLWAVHLYMIGAPVWWIAWRGGFAPEPDGVAIFLATNFTLAAVWLRKKYA